MPRLDKFQTGTRSPASSPFWDPLLEKQEGFVPLAVRGQPGSRGLSSPRGGVVVSCAWGTAVPSSARSGFLVQGPTAIWLHSQKIQLRLKSEGPEVKIRPVEELAVKRGADE